jgi:NADH:ubiquinone oxidoreductase subunit 2 (subunit N)
MVWLGLEINMFSFLLMIRERIRGRVEACVKYFFVQSLGSGLLLGRFYSFADWGGLMALILRYKIGGVPFFFWFPSVCSGIGWKSCFLLMTIQKIGPMILISLFVGSIIWIVIVRRLFVGMGGVINQRNTRRFIAYSSIHHVGWLLIAGEFGGFIWVGYLVIYTFLLLGVFIVFFKEENFRIKIVGLVREKWIFVFGMLSMGGLPPLLGFFLKWWIFSLLVEVDFFIVVYLIVLSVIIFYFYGRMVYMVLYGGRVAVSWQFVSVLKGGYISLDGLYIFGIIVGSVFGVGLVIYFSKIRVYWFSRSKVLTIMNLQFII